MCLYNIEAGKKLLKSGVALLLFDFIAMGESLRKKWNFEN